MPLFPASSVEPFKNFPARLELLSERTPILLHEGLLPLFLLFLTLLVHPQKSTLRNAIALPVILALYIRLSLIYTSSHWGFAFCVGAYTYFGCLQAFNLLVVKDVGRDEDVKWQVDDTRGHPEDISKVTNGVAKRSESNGHMNGEAKSTNGNAHHHTNGGPNETTKTSKSDFPKAGLGYPELSEYSLWQRIRWTISLIAASRGVGWKFQIRQIRPPPPVSRSLVHHVALNTGHILLTYAYLDFYSWFTTNDPYFSNSDCWFSPFHATPLSADKWGSRCLPKTIDKDNALMVFVYHNIVRKHVSLFAVYTILTQLFSIAAILFTFYIPASRPYSWAPLFGSIKDATSLRGFWTVFWHSIFKKGFSYPSEWLALQVLRLDRNSTAAQFILVSGAFINSAGLHALGCYTLCGRGLGAAVFFLLQVFGFIGESCILIAFKQLGVNSKSTPAKLLTTTWMMIILLWSCDVFFYDFLHAGAAVSEPVLWSIWRWNNGEEGLRWGSPKDWLRWDEAGSLGGWGVRL